MFNNPLSNEEANLKIRQRDQEAETHRLHKQLGYTDRGAARWIVVFISLALVMLILLF